MTLKDAKTQRIEEELVLARENRAAKVTVNAAFAVHTKLGPGLLESVYEKCLCHAIRKRGLDVQRQLFLPIEFEQLTINSGLRLDMVVDECLVVEVKAVEVLLPVHRAQLLTYLRLSDRRLGLLINFNVALIRDGITRVASTRSTAP
jgi:GxxExxY protein